jgi:hypothetical protein
VGIEIYKSYSFLAIEEGLFQERNSEYRQRRLLERRAIYVAGGGRAASFHELAPRFAYEAKRIPGRN